MPSDLMYAAGLFSYGRTAHGSFSRQGGGCSEGAECGAATHPQMVRLCDRAVTSAAGTHDPSRWCYYDLDRLGDVLFVAARADTAILDLLLNAL